MVKEKLIKYQPWAMDCEQKVNSVKEGRWLGIWMHLLLQVIKANCQKKKKRKVKKITTLKCCPEANELDPLLILDNTLNNLG